MKKCSKCRKKLSLENFYIKHIDNGKTFYRSKCKSCYSLLTSEQLTQRRERLRIYYNKNKSKISTYKKTQRLDKNSALHKYLKRGQKGWNNEIFDKLFVRYNRKAFEWNKKLMKIFGTNEVFEKKRVSIINENSIDNDQIYKNWKKRYTKINVWKNRKEIDYIFEFMYRRILNAQTNKISNINKNNWEKRFNSLASIMRLRA